MYYNSKIKKAIFEGEVPGDRHLGEVYISLCDTSMPLDDEKASQSNFFIAKKDYESVTKELLELTTERKSEFPVTTFLVTDPFMASDDHKYVLQLREPYYHFIINTLTNIFFIYEHDPKAKFFIFCGNYLAGDWDTAPREAKKNREFLADVLAAHGIPYYFLASDNFFQNYPYLNDNSKFFNNEHSDDDDKKFLMRFTFPVYKFKNVTILNDYSLYVGTSLSDITDLIDKYIIPLDGIKFDVDYKYVYISRNSQDIDDSAFIDPDNPSLGYKNNCRLFNEPMLEEYLESKGFYILKSDNTERHWEQLAIIRNASVVLGVTGTGLINSLFMKENKMVIELRVELIDGFGRQDLMSAYYDFAYARGHRYIALDISDKQATTAVAQLEDLFKVLDINSL